MRPIQRLFIIAFFAATVFGLPANEVTAQQAAHPAPPVALDGYSYKYSPRGQIHLFLCKAPKCGPGSKVSYSLSGPEKNPDFEAFKSRPRTVVSLLQPRLPQGTTLKIGTQEKLEEPAFTTFTSYREMQLANGIEQVTKSAMVYAENLTISIISSAENRETADGNQAAFLLGLLTWSEIEKHKDSR